VKRVNWKNILKKPVILLALGAALLFVFFVRLGDGEKSVREKCGLASAKIIAKAIAETTRSGDKVKLGKVIETYRGDDVGAIVVVDSQGTVLASSPPIAAKPRKNIDEPCVACHFEKNETLVSTVVFSRHDGPVARSFARINIGTDSAYLVVDIPVAHLSKGKSLLSVAIGLAGLVLLGLGIFKMFFYIKVVSPLNKLTSWVEGAASGKCSLEEAMTLPAEWQQMHRALISLIKGQNAKLAEGVLNLIAELRDRASNVQSALAQLHGGAQAGRRTAEAIIKSVGELDATMETIRSSMNAIATSTSDNSTSLIQMSASIDEVAASSDRLSQHVSITASAVFEMVQSVVEVSDNVEVLGRGTETTATSMAEIDASTRQIEENAREAAELSGRMAEAAREGSQAVQQTLQGIHDSHGVILETARAMDELVDASKAIGSVVKIINEINDKTKLLALNAAIIAAQAGEHGKSFAVVAHEIKNLSDRTAMSTGEISRIIRGIKDRTEVAREAVDRGKESTARGVELAEGAGRTLGRILSTAQVSHDMTREILRATEEQSRGSQSVMSSMEEVSSMVTYIRQAAQEHKKSGESVTQNTEDMRELTEQVKHATAEQAEVSRYLSEAIATIDRNLHELLLAVEKEREESEKILDYTSQLKERSVGEGSEIKNVEAVLADMTRQLQELNAGRTDLIN